MHLRVLIINSVLGTAAVCCLVSASQASLESTLCPNYLALSELSEESSRASNLLKVISKRGTQITSEDLETLTSLAKAHLTHERIPWKAVPGSAAIEILPPRGTTANTPLSRWMSEVARQTDGEARFYYSPSDLFTDVTPLLNANLSFGHFPLQLSHQDVFGAPSSSFLKMQLANTDGYLLYRTDRNLVAAIPPPVQSWLDRWYRAGIRQTFDPRSQDSILNEVRGQLKAHFNSLGTRYRELPNGEFEILPLAQAGHGWSSALAIENERNGFDLTLRFSPESLLRLETGRKTDLRAQTMTISGMEIFAPNPRAGGWKRSRVDLGLMQMDQRITEAVQGRKRVVSITQGDDPIAFSFDPGALRALTHAFGESQLPVAPYFHDPYLGVILENRIVTKAGRNTAFDLLLSLYASASGVAETFGEAVALETGRTFVGVKMENVLSGKSFLPGAGIPSAYQNVIRDYLDDTLHGIYIDQLKITAPQWKRLREISLRKSILRRSYFHGIIIDDLLQLSKQGRLPRKFSYKSGMISVVSNTPEDLVPVELLYPGLHLPRPTGEHAGEGIAELGRRGNLSPEEDLNLLAAAALHLKWRTRPPVRWIYFEGDPARARLYRPFGFTEASVKIGDQQGFYPAGKETLYVVDIDEFLAKAVEISPTKKD